MISLIPLTEYYGVVIQEAERVTFIIARRDHNQVIWHDFEHGSEFFHGNGQF